MLTDIYICGSLNHGSIFAAATEAAQHGFGIRLVKDCLGFTNPYPQLDKMKTILGASDANSQELIAESSGQARVDRIGHMISSPKIIRSGLVALSPLAGR